MTMVMGCRFTSFGNGYTFLVFDLSSDQADSGALQLVREGTVSLDMMFGADLPGGGVKLLAYLEYENLLYINAYREAYFARKSSIKFTIPVSAKAWTWPSRCPAVTRR